MSTTMFEKNESPNRNLKQAMGTTMFEKNASPNRNSKQAMGTTMFEKSASPQKRVSPEASKEHFYNSQGIMTTFQFLKRSTERSPPVDKNL